MIHIDKRVEALSKFCDAQKKYLLDTGWSETNTYCIYAAPSHLNIKGNFHFYLQDAVSLQFAEDKKLVSSSFTKEIKK